MLIGKLLIEIEVPGPVKLREVLEEFTRQAGFYAQLFDDTGDIKRSFTILVNGVSIYQNSGLDTTIQAGDEVAVLSFVAGG